MKQTAKDLLKINAVKLSPKEPFTWASGIKSPIYCDNRLTISYPEIRTRIAKGIAEIIKEKFPETEMIAGTATAGIPHAAWIAQELNLPSAPKQFIQYLEEDDRPQVALDVNYENGFGVSVGRLRKDAYFDWKFVGLSHNTIRGAAGGAVLMAELLKAKGYITAK